MYPYKSQNQKYAFLEIIPLYIFLPSLVMHIHKYQQNEQRFFGQRKIPFLFRFSQLGYVKFGNWFLFPSNFYINTANSVPLR
jgi:hypothetical protein